MKIVDAYWEKRNIGLKTYEVTVESEDEYKKILDFEKHSDYEYLVIKIPVSYIKDFLYLQNEGYKFIEMNTTCFYNCDCPNNLSGVQKRIYDSISYKLMSAYDIEYLFSRIKEGLFVTDRVYLDPFFSKNQSGERYVGWINDEIHNGSKLFNLMYKNKSVGFFGLSKIDNKECTAFLGGIYPEYQKLGLGMIMNYLEIDEARKQGAKKVKTSFSSNNRGAYAVHLAMNYILIDNYYVLIKHKRR